MSMANNIINYNASVDKVSMNSKTITEKHCKHCGTTSPLGKWRLTMGMDYVWRCTCPCCKKETIGL